MVQRLDILLFEKSWFKSRAAAQRAIADKRVELLLADRWQVVTKPGLKVDLDTQIKVVAAEADGFVSRGALKLKAALDYLPFAVTDKNCLDVGQSTGGFTDCLLQAGCRQVIGIDVGHDQLDPELRSDQRVICYEGINARDIPDQIKQQHAPEGFDLIVMDVSFISQTKILPGLTDFLHANGALISLVKPQFEVGKENIGKGGIVSNSDCYVTLQQQLCEQISTLGMELLGYLESPITGGDGNREFLLVAKKS